MWDCDDMIFFLHVLDMNFWYDVRQMKLNKQQFYIAHFANGHFIKLNQRIRYFSEN